jgi:predicted Na+-dependent transporter
MLFLNFLDLKITYNRLLRKELLITFFLSIVVMPTITYYVLSIGLETSYRLGLLLVSTSPSGIMGIIFIKYITYRDYNLAFSNLIFSTFCSIIYIPIILKLTIGQTLLIETRPLIIQTATLIILPFLSTRIIIRFFPEKQLQLIKKIANYMIPLMIFLIVSSSIGSAADQLKWDLAFLRLTVSVISIYLLHASLGYFAGSLIGKKEIKNTLTFISSSRNCQIVLALAILNFSPLTLMPIIIAIIFHHITNAFWLWMLESKKIN